MSLNNKGKIVSIILNFFIQIQMVKNHDNSRMVFNATKEENLTSKN